jgi:hypothetical protein
MGGQRLCGETGSDGGEPGFMRHEQRNLSTYDSFESLPPTTNANTYNVRSLSLLLLIFDNYVVKLILFMQPQKKNMTKKNLRFNRIEHKGRHQYLHEFRDARDVEQYEFSGFIKCRLVHHKYYSVIIPDQIYIDFAGEVKWIQPLYFLPHIISFFDDTGICELIIDISHGVALRITFSNFDLKSHLKDGSIFYSCKIKGPRHLYNYTTGLASIVNNTPYLKLYHHTTRAAGEAIEKSKEYWSSNWNIQGTKKSTNIAYLYLTSLPKIDCIDDLEEIAMSSQGRLLFRLDQNSSEVPDLILPVYRDSTANRIHTLESWIDASLLASQPCYRHMPPQGRVYYAVVSPFIYRIGVENGTTLDIKGNTIVPRSPKKSCYTIVGDATTIDGLTAPYDEENTMDIFKIEYVHNGEEFINFWSRNRNSNQFDNKEVEMIKFTQDKS